MARKSRPSEEMYMQKVQHASRNSKGSALRDCCYATLFAIMILSGVPAEAQITFSSGSTGADGALHITAVGVTYFDPVALSLPKNTNIFNFTGVTIDKNSTLKFSEGKFHGPVFLLSQGDVNINGTID